MKSIFFIFITIIIIQSCTRECDCECIKHKISRKAIVQNFTKNKTDTVNFISYRNKDNDSIIDSQYKYFLKAKYGLDSIKSITIKDSQKFISKASGLTCAGTNQFYKDSFYCNCKQ